MKVRRKRRSWKRLAMGFTIIGVVMLLALCRVNAQAATDTTTSIVACGTDGGNLTWTLDNNGVFTISGTGEMTDFLMYSLENDPRPWGIYRNQITR